MFPKPEPKLSPNTYAFESQPMVKPTGFREYDARWLFEKEINLMGAQALGLGLARLLKELGVAREVVVGHDFRSYSASIKLALTAGLMAGGAYVRDIGLALTPMAYFAQFALDTPAVAMVTASHNDNGWTGVKMGAARPVTFGPEEMARLRDIVIAGEYGPEAGGGYEFVPDFPARYIADLTSRPKLSRCLKVVAACGNGTAGAFAPKLLSALGAEVVPLDCELDFTFPRYNPNPEDMRMLHAMAAAVTESGADLALGFDGDGDRCGIVDNEGKEIFADKIGVMLARDLSTLHNGAAFVVDVKSTGLFATDPKLRANGARIDFWKTGHSHIKRRVRDLNALAGFEKSGHFFFNAPLGRGYDDGFVTAIAILDMLDRNPGKSMADLYRDLPMTWGSPTMSPHCADEVKYEVADRVVARLPGDAGAGRAARRAADSRSPHRQRRPSDGRGRDLGAGPRFVEQAGTGGRRREPGVGSAHARDVRGGRPDLAREPRSRRLQPDDLMRDTAASGRSHVLPDLLQPGLRIVFCGTAAGNVSAARGAYYAHPQNRFWSALHAIGLTPRQLRPEEYPEMPQWGLGLTDIAKHVSGMDRELPSGALGREAGAALKAKIMGTEPRWLAFTSLTAGRRISRPRRRLRRAARAHWPNPPMAPAVAVADRGLELGEQQALVADARRRGEVSGARCRLT